jgi:hypothetical protein
LDAELLLAELLDAEPLLADDFFRGITFSFQIGDQMRSRNLGFEVVLIFPILNNQT